MDYNEELRKVNQQMHDAEDALADMGFPTDQWMLIKEYIGAAIVANQITVAKAFSELSDPATGD
jgi:hypothetical protein